jgi:WD40 repeat protein
VKNYSNIQLLLSSIGKSLKGVLTLDMLFNDELSSSSTQEICFEFEGELTLRLFCSADGSSICWDSNSLQQIDMDEYGKFAIHDANENNLWRNLIDVDLEKIYLIESNLEHSVFAVKFYFGNDFEFVIANIGDDLVFQNQLSSNVLDEEKATFLDIATISM